jgi:hypothetical protein
MALIDTLRYTQFMAQRGAIRSAPSLAEQSLEYLGRDPATGDRLLRAADGGVLPAQWAKDTEPPQYPANARPPRFTRPGSFNA